MMFRTVIRHSDLIAEFAKKRDCFSGRPKRR